MRGCKQKAGVDYEMTYAPTLKYESLPCLLALAAQKDLEMMHFDIKIAFWYADLEEVIYVQIPGRLNVPNPSKRVLRLLRAV